MRTVIRGFVLWLTISLGSVSSSYGTHTGEQAGTMNDNRLSGHLQSTPALFPHTVDIVHPKRTPPRWRFEDQFEFYGFWLNDEMNIVRQAFLGVIDLLAVTMRVLGGNPWEDPPPGLKDPSFLRYFGPEDLNTFGAVLQRLLAILGAPNTDAIRQCIEATKLQLIYDDGKGGGTRCSDESSGVYAYYNAYQDQQGAIRSYLSLCPRFFSNFRPYNEVRKENLGNSIDIADPTQFSEAESGTAVFLHELLHWLDPLQAILPTQISDLKLIRPDDKSERTAYRSFYAMHVKDWSGGQSPLQNADSEIFYRDRFKLPQWQDSPDPHGPARGPDADT